MRCVAENPRAAELLFNHRKRSYKGVRIENGRCCQSRAGGFRGGGMALPCNFASW